jgi:hypothetical protein
MNDSVEGLPHAIETYDEEPFSLVLIGEEPLYASAKYAVWGNPDASDYYDTYVRSVTFMGQVKAWHKWAVLPLKVVEAEIKAKNITYAWTDLQTYNNRNIAGTKVKSMHAWPLAIDINPAKNPYRKDNKLITDIPYEIVTIFENNGFKWGGHFKTIKDPMHFEYIGVPKKEVTIIDLKKGDTGNLVREAQSMLAAYGYNLTVDGIFGVRTEAMVLSFQASRNLPKTGIINSVTWTEFKSKDRLLRKGTSGPDVYWMQRILDRVGHKITIDGIFGKNTEFFVKSFQTKHGLTADGLVGKNTWFQLRKVSN